MAGKNDFPGRADETVLAYPVPVWVLLWTGLPLLGAAAGLLLKLVVVAAANRDGLPLPGWFRLVTEVPEPWLSVGAGVAGLLVGLGLTGAVHDERLTVRVSPARVRLASGDRDPVELTRAEVSAVFLDGKQLVLLGGGDEEVARYPCDLGRDTVAAGFRRHGYTWYDEDPHREAYRRWVPGLPELPPGADALLRVREKALSGGDGTEARQLREELARLGVVVRDEQKRQFWRRHDRPAP